MNTIAILTLYYHNYNYGGVLQAYSLQRAVSELGYKAVQISYRLESGYSNWNPVKEKIKKPFAYIYHYLKYGRWFLNYNIRNNKINGFANRIPHTEVVTAATISKISNKFDFFICGSDQIWNPIGWQPTFFFDFLPPDKRRISYAASIARDSLSEEEFNFIRKHTQDFITISVREKNSANMLNLKYPDLYVQSMPDPVFLLDEAEWESLAKISSKSDSFIFGYFLGKDNDNRKKALDFSEKIGVKIVFASYLAYGQFSWDEGHRDKISPPLGVVDFLHNIANASLVLTDSFHAAAFSAIYRTPFYVMPRFNVQDGKSMNSRIVNLIEDLNLPERYTNNLSINYKLKEDELTAISINLQRLRKKGIRYLEQFIRL